jgi:MoxR-like ATPase
MEERQVTVDAVGYPVPEPFLVLATQNPIDLEGTYRLPEAQLDRFLMRIAVGYPDLATEEEILTGRARSGGPPVPRPVTTLEAVRWMVAATAAVHVDPAVVRYVATITAATRERPELRLGASPRGSLALLRAAQSYAAGEGRGYVVPDDVKRIAPAVLIHRLLLTPEAEVRGVPTAGVLSEVLAGVPVPAAVGAGVR